jgi:hypothetical protein
MNCGFNPLFRVAQKKTMYFQGERRGLLSEMNFRS